MGPAQTGSRWRVRFVISAERCGGRRAEGVIPSPKLMRPASCSKSRRVILVVMPRSKSEYFNERAPRQTVPINPTRVELDALWRRIGLVA